MNSDRSLSRSLAGQSPVSRVSPRRIVEKYKGASRFEHIKQGTHMPKSPKVHAKAPGPCIWENVRCAAKKSGKVLFLVGHVKMKTRMKLRVKVVMMGFLGVIGDGINGQLSIVYFPWPMAHYKSINVAQIYDKT